MDKLKVKKYLIENRILKDNISVEEMESFANGRGEGPIMLKKKVVILC